MHIDAVVFQVVGKRLLHIKNLAENIGTILFEAVQNFDDVVRLLNSAIEIGAVPLDSVGQSNASYVCQSLVIPVGIRASEFDFQTFQAVCLNPIAEHERITVSGALIAQFVRLQRIKSPYQMPRRKALAAARQ